MTKPIGPREAMLRAQREAGIFKGRDGKDLIGNAKKRARQAFAAAQAAIAAAPPLKTKETKMEPTQAAAAQAEPQAAPAAPKAAGKAKGAKKAARAAKAPGKAKKRASKPARAKPGRKKAAAGSKVDQIRQLLTRKQGTTAAEVLAATGWPAVSMPQQAKAAGLKLRKEKAPGEPTRYFGSP